MIRSASHPFEGREHQSQDAYGNQPKGYRVPNFHRITVHGSTFPMEWLKPTVNPRSNVAASADAFGLFRWQRMAQS